MRGYWGEISTYGFKDKLAKGVLISDCDFLLAGVALGLGSERENL